MATNADGEVTDEDFKKLKDTEEVETSSEEDESSESEELEQSEETSEEDEKSESQEEETEESDETEPDEVPSFTKEFPNIKGDTPEEYSRNLEIAYKNSTAEALRLKGEVDAKPEAEVGDLDELAGPVDPRMMYLDRIVNRDIQTAFDNFSKQYSQTKDPVEFAKFQEESKSLAEYNISKGILLTGDELYPKVAAILGWTPDSAEVTPDDKLKEALKNNASSSSTSSATKPKSNSKVTDAEVSMAKAMGGWTDGKSDAEIRKGLETVK